MCMCIIDLQFRVQVRAARWPWLIEQSNFQSFVSDAWYVDSSRSQNTDAYIVPVHVRLSMHEVSGPMIIETVTRQFSSEHNQCQ
jgi:hypothetical protein